MLLLHETSYHVYKDGWDAPIKQALYCEEEIGNHSDPCAVAVKRARYPRRHLTDTILFQVEPNCHKFISSS